MRLIATWIFAAATAALPAQEPADPIAKLISEDDSAVLRFASLREAGSLLSDMAQAPGLSFDLEDWLLRSPAVAQVAPQLAEDRPFAISWPAPKPSMRFFKTFVLPYDGELGAFRDSSFRAEVLDSYVAVSVHRNYQPPAHANPLGLHLPPAPIAGRVQLAPYFALIEPYFEPGLALAAASQPHLAEMGVLEAMRTFVQDARALDFGLAMAGGRVHLWGDVRFEAGSALLPAAAAPAAAGADLSRFLLPGEMIQAIQTGRILNSNQDALQSLAPRVAHLLPEGERERLQAFLGRTALLLDRSGPETALSGRLGAGGMNFVAYCRPENAAEYLQTARELYGYAAEHGIGMATVGSEVVRTVAGLPVSCYVLHFDMDLLSAAFEAQLAAQGADPQDFVRTLYGDGRLTVALGEKDGVVLAAQYTDEAFLERAIARFAPAEPNLDPGLALAMERTKDQSQRFIMTLDLAAVLHVFAPLFRFSPASQQELGSLPATFYFWPDTGGWHGGTSLPWEQAADFLRGAIAGLERGWNAADSEEEEEF